MLTNEEFDALEEKSNKLAKQIDIQLAILDKIDNENIFSFIWDTIITNKNKKVAKLCQQYIDENQAVLDYIINNYKDNNNV